MALKNNTWKLNQWYDQAVAGNVSYTGVPGMYVWGNNPGGRLGLNNTSSPSSTLVQLPGTWVHIEVQSENAGNGQQIGAINSDGELFTWGPNLYGALGTNQNIDPSASSPIQIPGTTWASVAAGAKNMGAVKTDGTLWVWGDARDGAMGQNSGPVNLHRSSPIQIPGTTWKSGYLTSAAYDRQYLAIKTDGTLWSWGNNDGGRLGINASSGHRSSPAQIPGTTWAFCAMGKNNSIAVKTDGTLWTWGDNDYGRLGINEAHGSQWSSPKQIPGTTWKSTGKSLSASEDGGMAIKTDGTLWAWGRNPSGRCGPAGAGGSADGGIGAFSSPVQIPGTTWSQVASGNYSIMAIRTDGTLWSWGNTDYGQHGRNYTFPSNTVFKSPLQVGSGTDWSECGCDNDYQAVRSALKTDGTLWVWGGNRYGQLGLNEGPGSSTSGVYSSPTQIPGSWAHALRSYTSSGAAQIL